MNAAHTKTLLAGVQWLFFMFTNTVVIPLSIGAAFDLAHQDITLSIQRSFVFTGIACILQALVGHRYALMDGQSGLWWGVILSLCASASSMHMSLTDVGGSLALGIVISGVIVMVFGPLGIGKLLLRSVNPFVICVFLLLLAVQLILIFVQGMIGLADGPTIDLSVTCLSLFIVTLVIFINLKGRGVLPNYSILIGIVVGWALYALLFPAQKAITFEPGSLLAWFPWGKPHFETGIVIAAIITGLINAYNTVVTLISAEDLYQQKTTDAQFNRSFILTGAYSVGSGILGLVPYSPYASSIGFLQSTRSIQRAPFIVGSVLFIMLGIFPQLCTFFSSIPISVGDAVLFAAYLQLFGAAIRSIEGIRFNTKTIYRIGIPALLGISLMNIPAAALSSLPALLRPLVGNGMLVGILVSILLENVIDWSKYEEKAQLHKQ